MKMNSIYLVVLIFAGAFVNTSFGQIPQLDNCNHPEIVVRFEQQPTPQALQAVEDAFHVIIPNAAVTWKTLHHAPHAKGQPNQPHLLSYFRIAAFPLATFPDDNGATRDAVCEAANSLAGVSNACWDAMAAEPMSNTPYTPNDPIFPVQWPLRPPTTNVGGIDAEGAWCITTGNPNIVIAIIDTGCRLTHQDLQANIWVNQGETASQSDDGIDNDNNGFVDDVNGWNFYGDNNSLEDLDNGAVGKGHGTGVSGIAAGRIDDETGIAGVSNSTIMTLLYQGESNCPLNSGNDSKVAQCIFYAVDNGAHVVNFSSSFYDAEPLLSTLALEYAHEHGVTVVASAGNAPDGVNYPASRPDVISVGATDEFDNLYVRSARGPNLNVVAPGVDVLFPTPKLDTSYAIDTGTSQAAPHVAGLVALMLSVDSTLKPDQIRALIQDNADDLGDPGFDEEFGHGRINAARAVTSVANLGPVGDVNRDGAVNFLDIPAFIQSLSNYAYQFEADVNCDGAVDFQDLSPFIALLTGA